MHPPLPHTVAINPALSALIDAVESIFLTPEDVAARWHYSTSHLSNWRGAQLGPAFVKIGSGKILYRLSEILAWEKAGESAHVTFERLAFALSTVPGLDAATRGRIESHLQTTVFAKQDST